MNIAPEWIIIPLSNPNKHSYTLMTPVCMISGNQAWDPKTNELGNNLQDFEKSSTRLATSEEIDSFYSELSKKEPAHIENFVKNILRYVDYGIQK